jgi:hypothetical protein
VLEDAPHKVQDLLTTAGNFIAAGMVSLEETQKLAGWINHLAGWINHLAQMLPFLRAFRRPMNDLIVEFGDDEDILLPVSRELAADIKVCANAALSARDWLPIAEEHKMPPFDAWAFVLDAAVSLGTDEWAGVASLASKLTTLECLSFLLPLMEVPDKLVGQHVTLGVNYMAVVFSWQNGGCKGDALASVLIRTLHVLASYLGCTLYMLHVSTAAATMADSLTWASTASADVWAATTGATTFGPPPLLWDWLAHPCVDWHLGFKLVHYLKENL